MKEKKESRWRQEQEQRRKDKSRKAIGYVLVIIFLILFLGISWRIYGTFKTSIWDGKNRLTLVLNTNPVSLASFDSGSQTISFLIIPDGTYIETTGGYGPYRIEKIYHLGELESKGTELLSTSLETYFGLPIDGWIMKDEKGGEGGGKQLLSKLITAAIEDNSLTNLSRWDLVRLWLMINRTRSHKIEIVDLGETTAAENFDLPDGTRARKIDNQRISRVISNLFTDYQIRQEDLAIAIMNAGTERGLAAKAARLVSNIGGRLVEIGDWHEKLENCQIRATLVAKKTYTFQKLSKVFGCQYSADLEKEARWEIAVILTGDNW